MHIYLSCHNDEEILADLGGTDVDDLTAARDYAVRAIRSGVASSSAERWRKWVLRVSDDLGNEIFEMPFSFILSSSTAQEKAVVYFVSLYPRQRTVEIDARASGKNKPSQLAVANASFVERVQQLLGIRSHAG